MNLCFPRSLFTAFSHNPYFFSQLILSIKVIAAKNRTQNKFVKFLKGSVEPNTKCGTKGLLCLQIHGSSASGRSRKGRFYL